MTNPCLLGWVDHMDSTCYPLLMVTREVLKKLRQYWCYGNRSVIGNRGGRWTFRNWGDTGLSPASLETTQTNMQMKHHTTMGAIASAVLLRKRGDIPNGSVPPNGSMSNNRCLTSLDLRAKVVRLWDGWHVHSRWKDSLYWLLFKWSDSDLPYQQTHIPVLNPD